MKNCYNKFMNKSIEKKINNKEVQMNKFDYK